MIVISGLNFIEYGITILSIRKIISESLKYSGTGKLTIFEILQSSRFPVRGHLFFS